MNLLVSVAASVPVPALVRVRVRPLSVPDVVVLPVVGEAELVGGLGEDDEGRHDGDEDGSDDHTDDDADGVGGEDAVVVLLRNNYVDVRPLHELAAELLGLARQLETNLSEIKTMIL